MNTSSAQKLFLVSGYYVVIFCSFFFLFYNQIYNFESIVRYENDLIHHIEYAGDGNAIRLSPEIYNHPGFHVVVMAFSWITHLTVKDSSIILLSGCAVLIAYFLHRIVSFSLMKLYPETGLYLITTSLLVISSIYAPFFNRFLYLGQGSSAVYHNPTLIAVKPLIFASLFFLPQVFQSKKSSWGMRWILASLLAYSSLIKPNFVLIFAPSLILLHLIQRMRRVVPLDLSGKSLTVLLAPTGIVLCVQYFVEYFVGSGKDSIILDWFRLWSSWSPNIFISLFLALAFPASLMLFRLNSLKANSMFQLSGVMMLAGIMQFGLFAEQNKWGAGNWGWSYVIGLHVIFVYATIEFFKWIAQSPHEMAISERIKLGISSILFFLHVSSGIYYFFKVMAGFNYA